MIKKIIIFIAILFFYGCNGCRNDFKHAQSYLLGMNREVTLYNANGNVINKWDTNSKIEDNGGTCYFIVKGKVITISGTFIIEEK